MSDPHLKKLDLERWTLPLAPNRNENISRANKCQRGFFPCDNNCEKCHLELAKNRHSMQRIIEQMDRFRNSSNLFFEETLVKDVLEK